MNARGNFARFTAAAAVAVSMMASISDAQAFRMIQNASIGRVTAGNPVACSDPGGFAHWTNSIINWYHNTAGQGSNKAAALQSALISWTDVPNANHVATYAGTTTAGFATDGLNTLAWTTGNGCTGSCLALTALVLQSGQVIIESDITFNAAVTWTTTGADFDTQTVAAHELGHSLGIHHTELTTTPRPTMYAFYFGPDGRSLEPDDNAALQCAQSTYPVAAPGAPTALQVDSKLCNGSYLLKWTGPGQPVGAYELFSSSNPSFSPQLLLWSGSTTLKGVNAGPSGTRYYHVRACNGAACSAFSNTVALSGFTGCQ